MLECSEVVGSESVRFGDNRNQVDATAESFHAFDIERLETIRRGLFSIRR